MQSSYKGYYLEEGQLGMINIYNSADNWRARRPISTTPSESEAKAWIDQHHVVDINCSTVDTWWEQAWIDAVNFKKRNTHQKAPPLDEALKDFTDEQLPEQFGTSPSLIKRYTNDIKKLIGGYFLIANARASDRVVSEVFTLINSHIDNGLSLSIRNWGLSEDRSGKIIAIDSYMSRVHEGGAMLDEAFRTNFTPLSFSILELLDMLAAGPEIHRLMEECNEGSSV